MSSSTVQEPIDEELVDATVTELVPVEAPPPPPVGLFRTDDPEEIVERASRAARALKRVIDTQRLSVTIEGREHVRVEGWQTLGSMLGVFPVKDGKVREIPWPNPAPEAIGQKQRAGLSFGYTASYRAQTRDGGVVGAGEADCKRTEPNWRESEDYALKSMAQTRAISKALRSPLGFIVTLAGYDPTPAEEMDGVASSQRRRPPAAQPARVQRPTASRSNGGGTPATAKQRRMIFARASNAGVGDDQLAAIFEAVAGTTHSERIPKSKVDEVLEAIEKAAR